MKNPFVFLYQATKPLTRLTDIETEEVSLVDKAANKRRFAVIKRDTQMNKTVNPEQFLEGLTTGLEQLTALTELVKARVEKAEDAMGTDEVDWKKSMTAMLDWASGQMASHFTGEDPAQPKTETGMAGEVAAQVVPGATSPTGDAAAGEAKVQADSVRAEVEGQMVTGDTTGDKGLQGDVASGEAIQAKDSVRAEVEGQMVTGTTVLTDGTAKPDETHSAGSVINKADPATVAAISKAVLDLASKVPSVDEVEKAYGMTEGLFFSGGINVDAYDIEALAAVVNALCEAMYDGDGEDAVRKSADRILAEVSKRMVTISKRVTKANEISVSDGKELKIVNMILKAVYDGMKPKNKDEKDDKKDKKKDKKGDKDKDGMKKDEQGTAGQITVEAINAAVADAVAKAIAPIVAENKKLTEQVAVAKAETEKVVKDYNALNTTQTRVSSSETTTTTEIESSIVHPNNLGVSDYNAKAV